jgi:pimeloyl-ACP methyl ester carboxylesterase
VVVVRPHTVVTGSPDAPAIVFLHGAGISGWMWTDQVAALSDRYRCVTVDLPGNGASHRIEWTSLADTAEAVAAIIGAVAGRAHVVGLSLGGYLTLELLARHPSLVDSAVVSGVTTAPLRGVYRPLTRLGASMSRQPGVVALMARAIRLPDDARAAYVRDARLLSASTVRRVNDEVLTYRPPPGLADHAHKLLAVTGDRELAPVRASLADLAALGATTAVAPNAHHAWNAEHPDLFTEMVRSWISARTVPTGLRTS